MNIINLSIVTRTNLHQQKNINMINLSIVTRTNLHRQKNESK